MNNQRFGANLKNPFFAKFCSKLVPFCIFSTSVWGAQHPNTGQNIQHPPVSLYSSYASFFKIWKHWKTKITVYLKPWQWVYSKLTPYYESRVVTPLRRNLLIRCMGLTPENRGLARNRIFVPICRHLCNLKNTHVGYHRMYFHSYVWIYQKAGHTLDYTFPKSSSMTCVKM